MSQVNPAWSPTWLVSLAQAVSWIEAYAPEWVPVHLQALPDGWDNTVFLDPIRQRVFRFPRREPALARLQLEAQVLPHLAGQFAVQIPQPTWVAPSGERSLPFLYYPYLAGETGCSGRWTHQARMALAPSLGRFLGALHRVDPETLGQTELGPAKNFPMSPAHRRVLAESVFPKVVAMGLVPEEASLWRLWDESVAIGWSEPIPSKLVHGDMYARHLLVDDQQALIGILDWGDMHLGDPAVDLEILHNFLPPEALPAFLADYGPLSHACWLRARFRALYHLALLATYAVERDDRKLLTTTTYGLQQMLRPANFLSPRSHLEH